MRTVKEELKSKANSEKAKILSGFFKTGKGEYGEGDVFLGVVVPELRKITKKYSGIDSMEVGELLNSKIHEERLCALFILIGHYKKADLEQREKIVRFYLANTKNINNWDLVDLSAPNILGDYLLDKDRVVLYRLVKSENLWERRIAVLLTFTFIREGQFKDSLRIFAILLKDKHDLIHKAVGWMLREIGKRDVNVLRAFLNKHYKEMPRTMLRYAIEKLDEKERKGFLGKK